MQTEMGFLFKHLTMRIGFWVLWKMLGWFFFYVIDMSAYSFPCFLSFLGGNILVGGADLAAKKGVRGGEFYEDENM